MQNFSQLFNLDDPIIEVNITPNRPDCLSVRGIARDLAAAGLGKLKNIKKEKLTQKNKQKISIKITKEKNQGCTIFGSCLVTGVKNIDMSTTVMGQKIDIPLFFAPTALQKLFHHHGEIAVGKADVDPSTCLFIDDNKENVIGAESAGFLALRYRNTLQLQLDLKFLGIN